MKEERDASRVKIGLEVHCQLTALSTKLFCGCRSDYRGEEPNTRICPVCVGLPGALPVLNRRAVEFAGMIALGLHCAVSRRALFYRKNYFYPDLPKNFQISQYDKSGGVPIGTNGWVEIGGKRIGIRRIHLEEDPGRLTYEGTIEQSSYSLVDYNRAGIALVEIVTQPDLSTPIEAKAFLQSLKTAIESLGVADGELEGAMRCDANVSISGGQRIEIKNISSFKEVVKALSYEALRQTRFTQKGREGAIETRHWDERRSITIGSRTKEEEEDYRYFPEPDLGPILMTNSDIARIESEMPELSGLRGERYVREYNISRRAANEIAGQERLANFFDAAARIYPNKTDLANWVAGDLRAEMSRIGDEEEKLPFGPKEFVDFLQIAGSGSITRVQAREVLREMVKTGRSAGAIVEARGLVAIADERLVERAVRKVVSGEAELVDKARKDRKTFNYLVGRVLKEEPSAEARTIARLLRSLIRESRSD